MDMNNGTPKGEYGSKNPSNGSGPVKYVGAGRSGRIRNSSTGRVGSDQRGNRTHGEGGTLTAICIVFFGRVVITVRA